MTDKLASNFLSALDALRASKGQSLTIDDIDSLLHHLEADERHALFEGVQIIAGKIASAKVEISAADPGSIGNNAAEANMELDAVIKATEDAANRIMDAAEAIQAAAGEITDATVADKITQQVTNLFTACDFQDITGQRISKVVKTLKEIEECVQELLGAISGKVAISSKPKEKKAARPDEHLMNGPQLEAPNQDDIDRLFSNS